MDAKVARSLISVSLFLLSPRAAFNREHSADSYSVSGACIMAGRSANFRHRHPTGLPFLMPTSSLATATFDETQFARHSRLRADRQANNSNFAHEQNDHGRERDPDGQRVASEGVRRDACPARASSY
jgi:hypothetical protein